MIVRKFAAAAIAVALFAAACSSNAGASQGVAGVSQAPAATPAATDTSASATSPAAASGATVMFADAGGQKVLVAGSNGMTVYTFAKDVANSGKSACSAGCLTAWPALTIQSGTPTAGDGVTGKLGTITRDDGSTQVTYNGMPLYFFHGDSKPGDTNGHYTGWNLVTP